MTELVVSDKALPGLYQSSNQASLNAQRVYYTALRSYLILLIVAAFVSFCWPSDSYAAIASASLFLITLAILVFIRVKRPDDVWYNGRAVAESVKTRAWRWIMRAEPYQNCENIEIVSKQFINDLKSILNQNRSLSEVLESNAGVKEPITEIMSSIRRKSIEDRLEIYKKQRIDDQANWYAMKSAFNKRKARQWFWVSVFLHSSAIAMLLYRIQMSTIALPIEVIATSASAALTWLQAKKHNELNSAYALTAHEIVLIKGESDYVDNEEGLSKYVVNSETAFSREHTQWVARKHN